MWKNATGEGKNGVLIGNGLGDCVACLAEAARVANTQPSTRSCHLSPVIQASIDDLI